MLLYIYNLIRTMTASVQLQEKKSGRQPQGAWS
jgi:hypothetical protein